MIIIQLLKVPPEERNLQVKLDITQHSTLECLHRLMVQMKQSVQLPDPDKKRNGLVLCLRDQSKNR